MLKNGYLWHRPELKNSCRTFKSISETTKSVRVTFLKNDAKFVKNERTTIHLHLLPLWICFQSTSRGNQQLNQWKIGIEQSQNIIISLPRANIDFACTCLCKNFCQSDFTFIHLYEGSPSIRSTFIYQCIDNVISFSIKCYYLILHRFDDFDNQRISCDEFNTNCNIRSFICPRL